jgi:hypothetical protein
MLNESLQLRKGLFGLFSLIDAWRSEVLTFLKDGGINRLNTSLQVNSVVFNLNSLRVRLLGRVACSVCSLAVLLPGQKDSAEATFTQFSDDLVLVQIVIVVLIFPNILLVKV